jgi:multiple sugar transport system substrate-binding protein
MSRSLDKQRTLDGVIGCRKSTWNDEDVNRAIPFYGSMESLHAHARELPRLANFVDLSAVIDRMVLDAINTPEAIHAIVRRAQQAADRIG